MREFNRIPCADGAYIEIGNADDGTLVMHVISPNHAAMVPVRLDAAAEKGVSVALQLRERARLERRRRQG